MTKLTEKTVFTTKNAEVNVFIKENKLIAHIKTHDVFQEIEDVVYGDSKLKTVVKLTDGKRFTTSPEGAEYIIAMLNAAKKDKELHVADNFEELTGEKFGRFFNIAGKFAAYKYN